MDVMSFFFMTFVIRSHDRRCNYDVCVQAQLH